VEEDYMPPLDFLTLGFLIFELSMYALGLACLIQAQRAGRCVALGLLAAVFHSYLTETVALRMLHEYYYNHFLIMLCQAPSGSWDLTVKCIAPNQCVPLAIPVMECVIIYAAMATSDRLKPPWLARPLLDGLLAFAIDTAIDPILSIGIHCGGNVEIVSKGVGFWVWKLTTQEEAWLGVDLNNFAGWFLGVATFSFVLRLCRRLIPQDKTLLGDLAAPTLAVLLTQFALAALVRGYSFLVQDVFGYQWIVLLLMVMAALLIVMRYARSFQHDYPIDSVVLAVPLFMYLFSFVAMFSAGVISARPVVFVVWLAMFVLGMAAFSWPYRSQASSPRSAHDPI
jgi:hypothetical protein